MKYAEELIILGCFRPFLQPGVLVLISRLAPALPPASFSHQCSVLGLSGLDYQSDAGVVSLITCARWLG